MSLYTDDDRDVGFLTKHDREFLEDPEGYAADKDHQRQLQYQRKQSIKKRLAQTLVDLTLLTKADEELRDDLLEGANDELEEFEQRRRERNRELAKGALPEDREDAFEEWVESNLDARTSSLSLLYEFFEEHGGVSFENVVGIAVTEAAQRQAEANGELILTGAGVDIKEPDMVDVDRVREKAMKAEYYDLERHELLYLIYSMMVAEDPSLDLRGITSAFTRGSHDPDGKPKIGEIKPGFREKDAERLLDIIPDEALPSFPPERSESSSPTTLGDLLPSDDAEKDDADDDQ